MKKLLLMIFSAIFIFSTLASCSTNTTENSTQFSEDVSVNSDVSVESESSETSEEKKVWTEVEEYKEAKITREYLDGKNDYTVTIETTYPGIDLSMKGVYKYKNNVNVYEENYLSLLNDTICKKTTTYKDDHGTPRNGEQYYKNLAFIQNAEYNYDGKGDIRIGTVKYTDTNEQKLAEGTVKKDVVKGRSCCVEQLSVYENGEIEHFETYAYAFNRNFTYSEYKDLNGKLLYTRKTTDESMESIIYGESEIKLCWRVEGLLATFQLFDSNDNEICAGIVSGNLQLTRVAEQYNEETAQKMARDAFDAEATFVDTMFAVVLDEQFRLAGN